MVSKGSGMQPLSLACTPLLFIVYDNGILDVVIKDCVMRLSKEWVIGRVEDAIYSIVECYVHRSNELGIVCVLSLFSRALRIPCKGRVLLFP